MSQGADESGKQLIGNTGPEQEDSRLLMLQKMMETDGFLPLCYREFASKTRLTKDQSMDRRPLKQSFQRDEIMGGYCHYQQ